MQASMDKLFYAVVAICTIFFTEGYPSRSNAAERPLQALIVTGQSLHSWQESSKDFEVLLESTGRLEADIVVLPEENASTEVWATVRPDFSDYDVLLLKYRSNDWPGHLKDSLSRYVHDGGGLVVSHSIVGNFKPWQDYQEMIGMGWNSADAGGRFIFDEDTNGFLRLPHYHGAGAGHGKQHEFQVISRAPDHPILHGLPTKWMQATDELYHGMRGPAQNLEMLATAFSDVRTWGSGQHEPILWTVRYGEGRVVVTVLGHRMSDQFRYDPERHELDHGANGAKAVHSVGFQTLLARGAEWAASGNVTVPVPKEFPTADKASVVSPENVTWE